MPRAPHTPDQATAAQLREARDAAGFTQEELGVRLGITRQYVGRLERGLRNARIGLIRKWLGECGFVLETISPKDPQAASHAAAIAEVLGELDEPELDAVVRVLRAWPRIPAELRAAIAGIAAPYVA